MWPTSFPDKITTAICLYAGREASAALRIALSNNKGASAACEAPFWEPFTYCDWHSLPPHNDTTKKQKRQRMWEYRKGFKVPGGDWMGYPTATERWDMFKSRIEAEEQTTGKRNV
jgi:hypothetical protein